MKQPQQKLKLLYLLRILMERTDEDHTISIQEMIDALSQYGINSERKSIYDDIDCLKIFGVDICSEPHKRTLQCLDSGARTDEGFCLYRHI